MDDSLNNSLNESLKGSLNDSLDDIERQTAEPPAGYSMINVGQQDRSDHKCDHECHHECYYNGESSWIARECRENVKRMP